MINYQKEYLSNGLTVILHQDKSTPLVCVNLLYKTGARNENPERTGMAHLFEHLMFGGSANALNFDRELELAGGENNAFTSNDLTNYYEILPAANIETALWLEADRMQNLNLDQKSIDIQKSVVVEEFKETELNQPYGDMDSLIREMAYKKHPYRWSTIGLKPDHIREADRNELLEFYRTHYSPGNAILTIAGNIDPHNTFILCEKYFGAIPTGYIPDKNIIQEPDQLSMRELSVERDVPKDAIMMAYHVPHRLSPNYHKSDLLSDIMANGKSSRFYTELVKEKQTFSDIDAFIYGSIDPGLLLIRGFPANGCTIDKAEEEIFSIIDKIKDNPPDEEELTKVKNKSISAWMFSNISVENKAFHLAFFEMLGNVGLINDEDNAYSAVSPKSFRRFAKNTLTKNNCSVLKYYAK